METLLCPEHHVSAKKNQWGKYAHTLGTGPDGKYIWCNKTAEQMGSAAPVNTPVTPYKPNVDSMLMCNAMNNTIALVVGGKIGMDDIPKVHKRILDILRGEPQF